jgi:hypothetical protein
MAVVQPPATAAGVVIDVEGRVNNWTGLRQAAKQLLPLLIGCDCGGGPIGRRVFVANEERVDSGVVQGLRGERTGAKHGQLSCSVCLIKYKGCRSGNSVYGGDSIRFGGADEKNGSF